MEEIEVGCALDESRLGHVMNGRPGHTDAPHYSCIIGWPIFVSLYEIQYTTTIDDGPA